MCVEALFGGCHRETNTWIADQIPSGEVRVAAVVRIAERALNRVREHEVEERGRVRRKARDRIAFDVAQKFVLIGGREPREWSAFVALRVTIDGGKPGSICLAKGCERSAKRAVDVLRCPRFGGARTIAVSRDEACRNRAEGLGFGRRECLDRAPDRCAGRLRGTTAAAPTRFSNSRRAINL